MLTRRIGRQVGAPGNRVFLNVLIARGYATQKEKSKQKDQTQLPVQNMGVMADFYIRPRFTRTPLLSWLVLVWRRLELIVINFHSTRKYVCKTKLEMKDLRAEAVAQFIKVNAVFCSSCNKRLAERKHYITKELDDIAGIDVIQI